MDLFTKIVVGFFTVYFLGELMMAHVYGKVGIPTHHNMFAHWLFNKHHHGGMK